LGVRFSSLDKWREHWQTRNERDVCTRLRNPLLDPHDPSRESVKELRLGIRRCDLEAPITSALVSRLDASFGIDRHRSWAHHDRHRGGSSREEMNHE